MFRLSRPFLVNYFLSQPWTFVAIQLLREQPQQTSAALFLPQSAALLSCRPFMPLHVAARWVAANPVMIGGGEFSVITAHALRVA
jgi:hypothetical protein